jgi:transposase
MSPEKIRRYRELRRKRRREKALAMLRDGKPKKFVARELKASRDTIYRWWRQYEEARSIGLGP